MHQNWGGVHGEDAKGKKNARRRPQRGAALSRPRWRRPPGQRRRRPRPARRAPARAGAARGPLGLPCGPHRRCRNPRLWILPRPPPPPPGSLSAPAAGPEPCWGARCSPQPSRAAPQPRSSGTPPLPLPAPPLQTLPPLAPAERHTPPSSSLLSGPWWRRQPAVSGAGGAGAPAGAGGCAALTCAAGAGRPPGWPAGQLSGTAHTAAAPLTMARRLACGVAKGWGALRHIRVGRRCIAGRQAGRHAGCRVPPPCGQALTGRAHAPPGRAPLPPPPAPQVCAPRRSLCSGK